MAKTDKKDGNFYFRQGHTESTNYGMATNPKSTAKADETAKDLLP